MVNCAFLRSKTQILRDLWKILRDRAVAWSHLLETLGRGGRGGGKGCPIKGIKKLLAFYQEMFILLAASSNWQIPCTAALMLNIKFVGLFTFLGSWGDLEVVRLEVEMWWNHPWPSSWKTPKHRGSPHTLILILSTICLETKNSWLGRLLNTVHMKSHSLYSYQLQTLCRGTLMYLTLYLRYH